MKKIFIAIIALIGFSVPVISQTVKIPVKKTDEKIKVDPVKPVAPPLKLVGIPKTFSKVPPKDKAPMGMKSPAAEKPKVTTPATPVVLKKDGTPDLRYKKNRNGKSK